MPNINDAFPSNYLKASDLKGNQAVVTIDKVEYEGVGREKEMKPILYFVGKEKGLVLNKTNAKNITGIASSPNTEDWKGMKVCLYPTMVEFSGEQVEAIRVKAVPRTAGKPAAPPPPPLPPPSDDSSASDIDDSDIPF